MSVVYTQSVDGAKLHKRVHEEIQLLLFWVLVLLGDILLAKIQKRIVKITKLVKPALLNLNVAGVLIVFLVLLLLLLSLLLSILLAVTGDTLHVFPHNFLHSFVQISPHSRHVYQHVLKE